MKKRTLLCLLLVFAAAAAIKYGCPEMGAQLREAAGQFVSRGLDYSAVKAAVSSILGREEETEADGGEEESSRELFDRAMEQWLKALKPGEEQSVEAGENEFPPAVAAFIAKQLSFPGQTIPKNVRLDMPELPFEYCCPVEGTGSSGFGFREHPIEQVIKFHYGTDFAANGGTAVYAFAQGSVLATGSDESYGNYIIIEHPEGFKTLYAHLSTVLVSGGQQLSTGDRIAQVGATGLATGPHLHFELSLDDVYLNPEYYL